MPNRSVIYVYPHNGWHGLELRDYFAAEALKPLIAQELKNGAFKHICDSTLNSISKHAYEIADAMIKEREK